MLVSLAIRPGTNTDMVVELLDGCNAKGKGSTNNGPAGGSTTLFTRARTADSRPSPANRVGNPGNRAAPTCTKNAKFPTAAFRALASVGVINSLHESQAALNRSEEHTSELQSQ